jgi:protein-S-isoprenylcysteine O-methyltransferase
VGVVPAWAQAAALLVLIGGGILLEWAVYLLGKHFSRTVMITSDQRLITAGPYRLLRHPAYTGMIIMDAAIVLGLGTWVGALVMLIVMLLPTLYRIRVEERVLESAFGEQYLDWARRTWRLFPGW